MAGGNATNSSYVHNSVHIITLVIEAFLIGLAQPLQQPTGAGAFFGCGMWDPRQDILAAWAWLVLPCRIPWRWLSAGNDFLFNFDDLPFLPASPGESVLV